MYHYCDWNPISCLTLKSAQQYFLLNSFMKLGTGVFRYSLLSSCFASMLLCWVRLTIHLFFVCLLIACPFPVHVLNPLGGNNSFRQRVHHSWNVVTNLHPSSETQTVETHARTLTTLSCKGKRYRLYRLFLITLGIQQMLYLHQGY